jgi:hypothetical protein
LGAWVFIFAVAGALSLAACSSPEEPDPSAAVDPQTLAEQMVAGDLATRLEFGPLAPTCDNPSPLAIGTTFDCTAATESGAQVRIQGIINVEGRIQLTTTNVITAIALAGFERDAAANLNDTVGTNFTADSVECGDMAVIVPDDFVLPCTLIMPSSGEVFDLQLTITDLDARTFSLVVGDKPRD